MGRKTTLSTFQATNKRNHIRKTWTWIRKGNLKREKNESLQIAAQNNSIRTMSNQK